MDKYFLQADAPWDVPSIESEPQQFVDEDAINEQFEPANDAFGALDGAGEWLVQFFTDLFGQIAGLFM